MMSPCLFFVRVSRLNVAAMHNPTPMRFLSRSSDEELVKAEESSIPSAASQKVAEAVSRAVKSIKRRRGCAGDSGHFGRIATALEEDIVALWKFFKNGGTPEKTELEKELRASARKIPNLLQGSVKTLNLTSLHALQKTLAGHADDICSCIRPQSLAANRERAAWRDVLEDLGKTLDQASLSMEKLQRNKNSAVMPVGDTAADLVSCLLHSESAESGMKRLFARAGRFAAGPLLGAGLSAAMLWGSFNGSCDDPTVADAFLPGGGPREQMGAARCGLSVEKLHIVLAFFQALVFDIGQERRVATAVGSAGAASAVAHKIPVLSTLLPAIMLLVHVQRLVIVFGFLRTNLSRSSRKTLCALWDLGLVRSAEQANAIEKCLGNGKNRGTG